MTPLDDLFSTDESRAEAQLEKVVTLNPADISDFPNHPFKVKQDEAMAEMVDSVKQYGVLVPALVRPKADGGYEMVAGHRRKCAATLAGITEMPCIVRNLTDDEATIIMVDSNLQRETILPSEKAFAYKMKLEAMKRQGQRSDSTSAPLEPKLKGSRSNEELAASSPDSRSQIQRFIRLTELIPQRVRQNPKRRKRSRRFHPPPKRKCRRPSAVPRKLHRRKHPNPNRRKNLRKHSRRNLSCPPKKNPQNRRLTFRLGSTMPKPMPKAWGCGWKVRQLIVGTILFRQVRIAPIWDGTSKAG